MPSKYIPVSQLTPEQYEKRKSSDRKFRRSQKRQEWLGEYRSRPGVKDKLNEAARKSQRKLRSTESGRQAKRAIDAAYYLRNADYLKQRVQKWRDSFPDKVRHMGLKYNYGISLEEYFSILNEQGGLCAICQRGDAPLLKGSLAVDHDHATGQVRGLLCATCNPLLGMAGESVDTLLRAAAYLEMWATLQGESL